MEKKESYTPQEMLEVAKNFGTFSHAVGRLEGLYSGATMSVGEIVRVYNEALNSRNVLAKLWNPYGEQFNLDYGLKGRDDQLRELGNLEVLALKESDE